MRVGVGAHARRAGLDAIMARTEHTVAVSRPPHLLALPCRSFKPLERPHYYGVRALVPASNPPYQNITRWPDMLFLVSDRAPPKFTFGEQPSCPASCPALRCSQVVSFRTLHGTAQGIPPPAAAGCALLTSPSLAARRAHAQPRPLCPTHATPDTALHTSPRTPLTAQLPLSTLRLRGLGQVGLLVQRLVHPLLCSAHRKDGAGLQRQDHRQHAQPALPRRRCARQPWRGGGRGGARGAASAAALR